MKIPIILIIVSSVLLPLQHLAAAEREPKKPTPTKKVTKKTDKKKATPTKKKSPAKKASPAKKSTSEKKKTTPSKKATPAKKSPATQSGSHVALASPELKKKAATWVKALPSSKRTKLLSLLNKGKLEDFKDFPGVGPVKFTNLKKGRPFKGVEDLANIKGFGEATFKAVVDHAKKMK